MGKINTVIFDIGRVLIGFEWQPYVEGLFDKETAKAVTDAMWGTGYWHELDRAVLSIDEILERFYRSAPGYEHEIHQAFYGVGSCVKRLDYTIPWIESLKGRGYQVLYLSNFSHHVMEANPQALDFLPLMDGGVFSCDVRLIKPDPAIYEVICRKYDLDPRSCLFIDDNAENIRTAREFGLNGIVFTSYEETRPAVEERLAEDASADIRETK